MFKQTDKIADIWKSIFAFLFFAVPLTVGVILGVGQHVMGVLLIIIGVLKLTDFKSFRKLFSQYDFFAKNSNIYSAIYPFLEISIGLILLFVSQQTPILQGALILLIVIMGTTLISFFVSGRKKKQTCACLGIVSRRLHIPLSIFTVAENVVMISMATILLYINLV